MELLLRSLTSIIMISSGITFSLTLFRIPFRSSFSKIVLVSFMMELICFTINHTDVLDVLIDYQVIIMVITEVILVALIFTLPFFYSLFIGILGFLGSAAVLIAIRLLLMHSSILSRDFIPTNLLDYIVQVVTVILLSITSFFIQNRKLGFMFTPNQFHWKNAGRSFRFGLIPAISAGFIIIHLTFLSIKYHYPDVYLFIALFIMFTVGMTIANKQNKKQVSERFGRLLKNKRR